MAALVKNLQLLIGTSTPADLGPAQRPGTAAVAELNKNLDEIFRAAKLPSRNEQLIRALILLWHDHLDASHVIAQDVEGADGAFVHGIMHRREPDFGNAAYWFRRVGKHPAFNEIATRAASLDGLKSNPTLSSALLPSSEWDPFAFIHLCEKYWRSSEPAKGVLQQVQAIETAVLLDHFSRQQ